MIRFSDYPALFRNADKASNNRQVFYFRSIFVQYLLLAFASAVTVTNPWLTAKASSAIYLTLMILAAAVAMFAFVKKPEKEWYSSRALAESVKTLSWRYMMCAVPFATSNETEATKRFQDMISELMRTNSLASETLSHGIIHGDQISEKMLELRKLPFSKKKETYLIERIENQLSWYSKKSNQNNLRARIFAYLSLAIYLIAILLAVLQYEELIPKFQWVSEPLLVIAASTIGWVQAKRYSELATSYNLATHEIYQIKNGLNKINKISDFSDFVNESETAFSREHTQWIARQNSSII